MKTRLQECDFDQCNRLHLHWCDYCSLEFSCVEDYCERDYGKLCAGCAPLYDALFAWFSAHSYEEILELRRLWTLRVYGRPYALSYSTRCDELTRARNLCDAFIHDIRTGPKHPEKRFANFILEVEDTQAAKRAADELFRYDERKYGER